MNIIEISTVMKFYGSFFVKENESQPMKTIPSSIRCVSGKHKKQAKDEEASKMIPGMQTEVK